MAANRTPMICARCGHEMNHHAEKLIHSTDGSPDPVLDGIVEEVHACPGCGAGASRPSVS